MYLNVQDDLGCFIYNISFLFSMQEEESLGKVIMEGECVLDLGSTSMTTALSLLVACMASL